MDIEFRQAMHLLSVKAVLKRMEGLRMLHRRALGGDQLSILALEYVLEHDPNSAVKNRASLVLKRSSLTPREGHWERHVAF
jgi:hypothetical protein